MKKEFEEILAQEKKNEFHAEFRYEIVEMIVEDDKCLRNVILVIRI